MGTIFYNAKFYTLSEPPVADALAVERGRILALGSLGDVKGLVGTGWRRVDLGGRTVLPGFQDAHLHLLGFGLVLGRVRLDGARSLSECVRIVAEHARKEPPGTWIVGKGWNHNIWPEGRLPTRWDLDPVSPQNPVVLSNKDGHSVWANTRAIREAGISEDAPEPEGGVIVRDEGGRMTGVFRERAVRLIWRAVPEPSPEERVSALLRAQKELHRMGIVAVHTMEGKECLEALQELRWREELRLRTVIYIPEEAVASAYGLGVRSGFGDELLRIGGTKLFADGSLGSQTAALREPYCGMGDYRGVLVHEPEELKGRVVRASEAGLDVAVHAIGDRAVSLTLDAIEAALPHIRRYGLRPRIEHAQLVSEEDLLRMARLGVVASMQPSHAASDRPIAERYWGKRCSRAYAWRSVSDSGVTLAFGSDAPVEPPDPMFGLYVALTRRDEDGEPPSGWHPEQRLRLAEALKAYTYGAAFAGRTEKFSGTLEPGKCADFVVLSDDPFRLPPEALREVKVEATFFGGEGVFP